MPYTRRAALQSAAAMPFCSWEVIAEGMPMQDDKPIPKPSAHVAQFERLAFGMFIHWGLYSQLGAGEWAMNFQKIAAGKYLELMKTFSAKEFNGREIARAAKRAGMKYVTLTSRHHEGFSLYDTRGLSKNDVMHTPAKRDLIKDFTDGCRTEGIVPMLYCTTLDWTEPRFNSDFDGYLKYLRESIEVLCTHYGKIGGFWFDGNWSKRDANWREDELYATIRRRQPEAMIINNTGIEAGGKLGNPEIDSVTFERGRPHPLDRRGHPKYVSAEMCHTMNFHWGIASKDFNYLSPAHVIEELCRSRRAGANLLMNVGPTAEGRIPDYEKAALARVGDWVQLAGGDQGPIYQGVPAGWNGEGDDFALRVGNEVYAFIFDITPTSDTRAHGGEKPRGPGKRTFKGVFGEFKSAKWMDNGEELKLEQGNGSLTLHATGYPYGTNMVVRVARITGL